MRRVALKPMRDIGFLTTFYFPSCENLQLSSTGGPQLTLVQLMQNFLPHYVKGGGEWVFALVE